MGTTDLSEFELGQAVMSYLEEHPEAMDTRDGIAEWWLARHEARVELRRLSRVLEKLAAEGILETEGDGENTRYHLRRSP